MLITRENIDKLIDARLIEVEVSAYKKDVTSLRWWTILRIGRTWRGKRAPERIRLPFKAGLDIYDAITEGHFLTNGGLNPTKFRIKQE
jgi:hypothetical protein